MLYLGSLFSGSGGFELAGSLVGIEPKFASEIEPFPIRVTTKRFPNMKHLGDVSRVKGGELEPVDIITFGSPCQDLSVAGKRAGLKNEIQGDDETTRSGLFFDAMRIIKEMRSETPGKPRYALWENVGGAFSSNGGQDFRAVLEEFCHIVDPDFKVPMPLDGWKHAGVITGENFELCWRTFDAQYWGVPQRRKRIYMLFDADGHTAKKIMFDSDDNFLIDWGENSDGILHSYGLTGKGNGDAFISEERHCTLATGGGEPGQGYPACLAMDGYNGDVSDVQPTLGQNCGMSTGRNGIIEADKICLNDQGGQRMDVSEDRTGTLRAHANHPPIVMEEERMSAGFLPGQGVKAHGMGYEEEMAPTLKTNGQAGVVEKAYGFCPDVGGHGAGSVGFGEEVSPTIISSQKAGVTHSIDMGAGKSSSGITEETAPTLATTHGGEPVVGYDDAIPLEHHPNDSRLKMLDRNAAMQTLAARMGMGGGNVPLIMVPIDVDRVVGTLAAVDGPGGFHSQSVGEGKYVIEVPMKPDVIACLESGGQRPSHHGPGFNNGDISYTLNTVEKPIVVYGIGSYYSNAMLSENPESGIYEADTSKTIDCNGGNPACHQGGMAVCEPVEECFGIDQQAGKGCANYTKGVAPTMCHDSHGTPHAVCYPASEEDKPIYSMSKNSHMTSVMEDQMDTICASQYKDPPVIAKPIDDTVETDKDNQNPSLKPPIVMATQQGGAEIMEDKCPTITASAGMSGNNQPVVTIPDEDIAFSQNQREEVRELGDVAGALPAEKGTHQQTYIAEKQTFEKKNFGGRYEETDMGSTLKASGGDLGGGSENIVREMIDENNANAQHQQDLLQSEEDVGRTLAAGTHGSSPHLTKTVISQKNGYIVRRLTPAECAKLQGFPTWWCKGLGTDDPTDEEVEFWRNVFLEWGRITGGTEKPKSDKQIRTWLKDPYSDASEYKLWGNGINLQCALYIMRGIAATIKEENE